MGVLDPIQEFDEGVPATPPGLQDLQVEENSEDDLFSEPKEKVEPQIFTYNNDLSFKDIIPVLPAKGEFENILDLNKNELQDEKKKKKKKFCSRCFDEVKKDLKKLAKVIEGYRKERDDAKSENEKLKKEVEELKKRLKEKEDKENSAVKVSVTNKSGNNLDIFVHKKNTENNTNAFDSSRKPIKHGNYEVKSFSISTPEPKTFSEINNFQHSSELKPKKTNAELRREFFAQEFKSEQKSFVSRNFLEVKPKEDDQETFRSKLNIRVKPRQNVKEAMLSLTSKLADTPLIPEAPKINLFQRFERSRIIWGSFEEKKVFC